MRGSSRSLAVRIGMGLAGLAAAAAAFGADGGSEPAKVPARPVSHQQPAPAAPVPDPGPDADPGCMTVDANGVPLHDSQYQQRTGHPPC